MINQIQLVDNQVQVKMQGSICGEEAVALRETLLGYIEKGNSTFLIDLGGVDCIDSSGLGMLVTIQKQAFKHGGGVSLKGINGLVKDVFEMVRLDKMFEIQ